MKYIHQLAIILLVSLAGEILHYLIPLTVPASIYGLAMMLILLCSGAVKLHQVENTADFLIEIMPLMFIPGGVGLLTAWDSVKPVLVPLLTIILVTTVLVMAVTGKTAELIMKRGKKNERI